MLSEPLQHLYLYFWPKGFAQKLLRAFFMSYVISRIEILLTLDHQYFPQLGTGAYNNCTYPSFFE